MGKRRALVEARRDEINRIVREHRGRTIALFGSVARSDMQRIADLRDAAQDLASLVDGG
jgi:predicted nucleotidyltransferase